jgi:sulfopyruvate decarboxylase subunit beta
MQRPEKELITILKGQGVDFTCSLPCEKIKDLLEMVEDAFFHVPLTREEEGVGICAGAALSGKRPAMFVQSSGVGNMINALLSLTAFYELPLAVFVSRRGVYKEKIAAQVPMGARLPMILRGAGISHTVIDTKDMVGDVRKRLADVYKRNEIHVFLLSPRLWEVTGRAGDTGAGVPGAKAGVRPDAPLSRAVSPRLTRYEVLKRIAPHLDAKVVVCNLGFPSKELFSLRHQPSNFYMLGSMGMATPIGLGIALAARDRQVVVIEGDGSLLMNPGTLATAAHAAPANLTVIAIDNGAYGSTGDQPTLTRSCVDLEAVARGFGIRSTYKVSGGKEIIKLVKSGPSKGPRFIHVIAVPGNEDVPNISLHHLEIKRQVQDFLNAGPGASPIPSP